MSKEYKKELIKEAIEFSNVDGISGYEDNVATLIKQKLATISGLTFDRDNLGSLAVFKKGTGGENAPTISFMAHMDEVGFMITDITKEGFVKFIAIGGWWGHVVLGQRLKVILESGKELVGIVGSKAPHLLTPAEAKTVLRIKDLFLDFGADSKEQLEEWGVSLGDHVVPYQDTAYSTLNPNRIIGKAFDDRIAILMGIELIRRLEKIKHEVNVIFIASVQEEVGLRGSKTSSYKWTSDIGFAVDVTFAHDTPGMYTKKIKLGTGVVLSLADRTTIANPKLIKYMGKLAKANNIKYAFDSIPEGWNDSGSIHLTKDGIINMTLSIPLRYMHSHNTMIDLVDLEQTIKLGVEFVKSFTKDKLKELKYK